MMLLMRASDPAFFAEGLRKSHEGKRDFTDAEVEELRQWVLSGSGYVMKTNPKVSLGMILPLAAEIAPILYQLRWAFVSPSGALRFVTTDNPVSWEDERTPRPASLRGHGLLMKNVELINFPYLSRGVSPRNLGRADRCCPNWRRRSRALESE